MNHFLRMGLAAMLCVYGHTTLPAAAAAGAGAAQVVPPKAIPSINTDDLQKIATFLSGLTPVEQEAYRLQLIDYLMCLATSLSNYLRSNSFKSIVVPPQFLLTPAYNLELVINQLIPSGSPFLQARKLEVPIKLSSGKIDISHHFSNRSLLLDLLSTAQASTSTHTAPAQPAASTAKKK